MIQGLTAIERTVSGASGTAQSVGTSMFATPNAGAVAESSFSDALAAAATRAVGRLDQAESLSINAVSGGEIETRAVVDAVMNAEQTLQASIAIRDKVVQAYLEVSRMAI